MKEPSRELLYLSEVTRTLIQVADGGARAGSREIAERFRTLAKGSQALRYKRLYWILDALAIRLAKPRPEMSGAPLEELGRLLADGRYTCKALKSLLGNTLEDPRVREDLIGSAGHSGMGIRIQNRSLIRVGLQSSHEGAEHYRTSYLLDTGPGELFAVREHRTMKGTSLEQPFADLGDCPRVEDGLVLPSFEPARLQLSAYEAGPRNEAGLRDYLENQVAASVGGLLAAFRSRREEYLAPRNLPVFFRPAAYVPGPSPALVDRDGHLIPLLREATTYAECEHLAFHMRRAPGKVWGVFGKLAFVTGDFFFSPWSLLVPADERLVVLL